MRITRYGDSTGPTARVREGRRNGIPTWLREWLADNRGEYVLLTCGHTEDLNLRGVTIIVGSETAVLCSQCDDWTQVVRPMTWLEYAKVTPLKETETPMF